MYTSWRGVFFSSFSFLFCLSHRGSQTVSNLAGGVADVYFSITLIIDLNAVAATDNKGLKRDSLAESGVKKRGEEQEGQCMNYTSSPQSEVPALFMSIKPTQLSQNGALSAVECNSSSLNT